MAKHDELRDIKDQAQYDFITEIDYAHRSRKGIGEDIVRELSAIKGEPQWMLDFRLKALDIFMQMPMPEWGADLGVLNFEDFYYYMRPVHTKARSWEDVPEAIKDTFEKLGIPEAERKFLAGVETQMDSEAVYSSLREEWERHGIIFVDMDSAVREYPELVREHISKVVPIRDNKFAALNSAFWSGGSFVYVPPGVDVDIPLQAYFRINAQSLGQFERTIIIADEGSNVHYIEGCTAPQYTQAALHTGVIEIFVKRGAHARYTTIQNWSRNVYNLVTQRAVVDEAASMEWVDGNLGCLTSDVNVLLVNGAKRICDVEPGDSVYALTPALEWDIFPVIAKKYSGQQKVFRLQTEDKREVKATANHPFLALTAQDKTLALQWKRLDELKPNDWIAVFATFEEPVIFCKVIAIELLEIEDTWDLEIADAHNFVANGIVVHNSGITMKYPAVVLRGPGAHGEVLSIAFAGDDQHYDAGAKALHLAPHTTSVITSKSISKGNGRSGFRGLVKVTQGAVGAQSKVVCDALLLDSESRSDTYPYIDVNEDDVQIEHEATVSKISEEQLFYLQSRGLSEEQAAAIIINGFLEPFVKELPMEYAIELNRLVQLQMEGGVG